LIAGVIAGIETMTSSGTFRSTDVIEILRALDSGTTMQRFRMGRRDPLKKHFCLKLETFEIQQLPILSANQRGKTPQPEEYG